jgi:hypothetical protein
MRKFFKNILLVTLPACLFLFAALEIIFRIFIPASQIPNVMFDNEYRILKYDKTAVPEGYASFGKKGEYRFKWRINNEGWNSPVDYPEKRSGKTRIAVIGDSYTEAFQVNNDSIFSNLLQAKLGDSYEVFTFGMSGAPLSQYLHMSRYVTRKFDPDILVINVVHNDFDESLREIKKEDYFLTLSIDSSGIVTENEPPINAYQPNPFKRILSRSATVRYFTFNMNIPAKIQAIKNHKDDNTFNANIKVGKTQELTHKIEIATKYIVEKFKNENIDRRVIFVIDAPRADIYAGKIDSSNVLFLEKILQTVCELNHVEFLSLTHIFQKDFEKYNRAFNAPYDYHWDEYGHLIVGIALEKSFFRKK